MAKGICVFFISLLLFTGSRIAAQDTITFPLHVRAGFDIAGAITKFVNSDLISYGALLSLDLNESISPVVGVKYTTFSSSEVTYDYQSQGVSLSLGADYNFIKPKISAGKYYAGIGMRYGLSFYSQQADTVQYTNQWGTGEMSLPLSHHTGHFLEFTPGIRTELFPGLTIGWNLYMRILLSTGSGKDIRPVYMPGYGSASSPVALGVGYFVSLSVPYKKIRVYIKPKPVSDESEEGEEGEEGQPPQGTTTPVTSGNRGRL